MNRTINHGISRRGLLRGIGASLALPALESVAPFSACAAAAGSSSAPKRMVSLFMPNGVYPPNWNITGPAGRDFEFSPILKPLEAIREDVSVIAGLDNSFAKGHPAMTSAFLSGFPRNGKEKVEHPSIDQIVAQTIGKGTRLSSLVLGTEPPRGGKVVASSVSWSSGTSLITPELNPRTTFDLMFRQLDSPEARLNARQRRSVLDLALDDAKSLKRKVSKEDQHKLDEYLTSVREVEVRIEKSLNPDEQTDGWHPLDKPSLNRPDAGIPRNREIQMDLLIDMIVLGLQTDTTRVATLMMGHGFSRKSFTFLDGVVDDHHTMSHHKGAQEKTDQYTRVSRWHIEKTVRLMEKMKAIDEGEGKSLLDNSLVMFGSSMKDGNGHVKDDLPLVIGGKAGGAFTPGEYQIQPKGTPHCNLLLSMLQIMGVGMDSYAGSTGTIGGVNV